MNNNLGEQLDSFELKKFYDSTTNNIQTSALVNRALADKISTETINQKVNNQYNSIYFSMNRINPKFNESSKKYGVIKKDILDVLTDYEVALTEYSDYYDLKLEELILKKVELESNLIGKLFRDELLKKEENSNIKLKEKDNLKMTFSEKAKDITFKVSSQKNSKSYIDSNDIRKLKDLGDLEAERANKIEKNIIKVKKKNKSNQNEIEIIESEIKKVANQINEINEKKRLGLENAMETKEKWIMTTLKKPSIWAKTKRFFANRFNTEKVISNTVINPLKLRITEFRDNELKLLKE